MADKFLADRKYLRIIYTKFKEKVIDMSAPFLLPRSRVTTSYSVTEESCFCTSGSIKNSYSITFGGKMLSNMLKLPCDLTLEEAKLNFEDTQKAFRGVYYHEMSHLKYTAMHCTLIKEYDSPMRGSLHQLFNILEDIVIERYCMGVNYPYTKKYFLFLESKLFNEEIASSYEDTEDYVSFCNWLLLKLRMRKAFTGTNKFVDEHPEYINYVRDVMTEPNGVERIKKTIVFFEWLVSENLIPERYADCEYGDRLPFSSGEDTSEEMPEEGQESSTKVFKVEPIKESEDDSGSSAEDTEEETDSDDEDEDSDNDESSLTEATMVSDPIKDPSININDMFESFESDIIDGTYSHSFYTVKEHFTPTKSSVDFVTDVCDKISVIATQVSTRIKTFKMRSKPRYQKGFPSGRLHVPSAIEGKPVNIFQRKEEIAFQNDLAIYLLVDNSGSMGVVKSRIATETSLAMSLACDKAHIPFAVSMFTSNFDGPGAECVTYRIKTFKDDFNKVRDFFGILDVYGVDTYQYDRKLPTFQGNTDEINLFHIAQEYRKEKYKNKVLIVISDGGTCGSSKNLISLVKDLEKEFYIIGIGACTSDPAYIYTNHKIFRTTDELVGLPEYIGDTLFSLSKGRR